MNRRPRVRTVLASLSAVVAVLSAVAVASLAHAQPPSDAPHLRHLDLKQVMLTLINEARADAGVTPLELGVNDAAQQYVEAQLRDCSGGHWGLNGLKPYMRYSLAGGYQLNGENAFSWEYESVCGARGPFPFGVTIEEAVRSAQESLMNSSGHRRAILNPHYRRVNIGIAWQPSSADPQDARRAVALRLVQHFEGAFVQLDSPPTIDDGALTLSGNVTGGAALTSTPGVFIRYDPPPRQLAIEDLEAANSYCAGIAVAAISSNAGWRARARLPSCYDPLNPDLDPARRGELVDVPTVAASSWQVTAERFAIGADLSPIIASHGPGVYTVSLRGRIDDVATQILEYAIFVGVEPPLYADAYLRRHNLVGVFVWHAASRRWTMYAERNGQPVPGSTNVLIDVTSVVVPIER